MDVEETHFLCQSNRVAHVCLNNMLRSYKMQDCVCICMHFNMFALVKSHPYACGACMGQRACLSVC